MTTDVRPLTTDTPAAARVRAFHEALADATGVSLPLRLPDGSEFGPDASPYRIVLAHWGSLRPLALPPHDLHAGAAYADGLIDIEGDLEAAMLDAERVSQAPLGTAAKVRLGLRLIALPEPPRARSDRRAQLRGRRHSKARDRAAIAFHYDLPLAFYQQFLDSQLVYSCAYYLDASDSVDAAQERKLDVICRKLRLQPGQRLLDIGCGFGSLLLHAAKHYGVTGVGATLSQTQHATATERIAAAAAGLADRVEVRLQDYRDVDGEFDAVVSVGMFEHVGPERLAEYFAAAYRLTRDGGLFLNHGITLGDATQESTGRGRTFVSTYVFPDGGLVPAWRAVKELEQAGFRMLDVEQLRPSYAHTLRAWVRRLEAHRDEAVAASSEADYRVWRAYMAGSAHSFEHGHLGLVQVLGTKGGEVPLGRAWMLPADGDQG